MSAFLRCVGQRATANRWERMMALGLDRVKGVKAGEYLGEYLADHLMAVNEEAIRRYPSSPTPIEDYINGNTGFEIRISVCGTPSEYLAVFHWPAGLLNLTTNGRPGVFKPKIHRDGHEERHLPVLIGVPEFVEDIEGVPARLLWIGGVVRLYRVNGVYGYGLPDTRDTCLLQEKNSVSVEQNRKRRAPPKNFGNQSADQIVQRRPQIVYCIPGGGAELIRQGFEGSGFEKVSNAIRLLFCIKGKRIICRPLFEQSFELLFMGPRPLEPRTVSAGWIGRYGVSLTYDRGQQGVYKAAYADGAQGLRDTYPNAKEERGRA